ncbi:hypothetical protein ACFL6S_34215, partial [Candidatus Poribacteria bacterium]
MKARFITSLALLMSLLLVSIAMEANAGHISTVEIHVDGFVCATCVRQIEKALEVEGGVAQVTGDWEKGIVAVIPDQEIGWVDLLDIKNRINSTRNYSVLKMDVVAVGTVTKSPVEYYVGGLYAYSGDRYILRTHDARKRHFILAQNEKLDELIEAGHKAARLMGTVTAFSREKVPIMEIGEFQSLDKEEETKVVESYEVSPEVIPDQIVSIDIHVDGYICATCVRALKLNLLTEEGVAAVDVNLETGVLKVIPALDEEAIDPFY